MKRDRFHIKRDGEIEKLRRDVLATDHVHLRCSPLRKAAYIEAARKSGKSLSEWIFEQLDRALARYR